MGDILYLSVGGPGRAKLDVWREVSRLQRVLAAEVTRPYFYEDTPRWDDDVYPERFGFRLIRDERNVGVETLPAGFIEAIQYSATTKGSPIPIRS